MNVEPVVVTHQAPLVVELGNEPPTVATVPSAPTEVQTRVADHLFTPERETNLAVGLIGLHAGILLLHDLALETFSCEDEEEKPHVACRRPRARAFPEV